MGIKQKAVVKTAFENYQVVRRLGAGGSGEVYEVLGSDGQRFAIKALDPGKARGDRLQRFRNEFNFCQKDVHPNILKVFETGLTEDGSPFYVMPLYPGTLRNLIDSGIPEATTLHLIGQIFDAAEAAHLRGVWHRDLKPENILHSEDRSKLVVADFGIAHFEEEEILTAVETKNSDRLANFTYAAPEQRIRGGRVDEKADVYSLGLILNEMFTRKVPLGTGFRKISDASPNFAYLDDLVENMLNAESSKRPTVSDVKRELIARGNEFLSIQKLNSLRTQVIPESDVDDPIVTNPIKLQSVDYENELLKFKLSTTPPPNWIAAFQSPVSYSGPVAVGPEYFTFHHDVALVQLRVGAQPQVVVENAKRYIGLANERYTKEVISRHREKIHREREAQKKLIEAEQRRKAILGSIKL